MAGLDLDAVYDERFPNLRAEVVSAYFNAPETAAISLPPDWVCEVLSDSTEPVDRGRKMRIWRRDGVRHVWLVSPEHRTLEVYRLENGRYTILDTWEGEDVEPFEEIELPLGALWKI
ncbi:MAG: Uma2 family endonuclease [Myxococcales bacterium]